MKIERFLLWLEHHLLNYPNIDMRTVKRIIDRFSQCLSPKEFETFHLYLEVLTKLINLNEFYSILFSVKFLNVSNRIRLPNLPDLK